VLCIFYVTKTIPIHSCNSYHHKLTLILYTQCFSLLKVLKMTALPQTMKLHLTHNLPILFLYLVFLDEQNCTITIIVMSSCHPALLCHPPSYWVRLFLSETFPHINTPTYSNLVILHTYLPMKMEQTQCSETSAYKIQMSGNQPQESIKQCLFGTS